MCTSLYLFILYNVFVFGSIRVASKISAQSPLGTGTVVLEPYLLYTSAQCLDQQDLTNFGWTNSGIVLKCKHLTNTRYRYSKGHCYKWSRSRPKMDQTTQNFVLKNFVCIFSAHTTWRLRGTVVCSLCLTTWSVGTMRRLNVPNQTQTFSSWPAKSSGKLTPSLL